jgi:glycosyltransferase involved in cell wall biosynthesis
MCSLSEESSGCDGDMKTTLSKYSKSEQLGSLRSRSAGLRILFCIPTLRGGGAERQLGYIIAGLTAQGVEVHLIHHGCGPNLERIEQAGARIHRLRGFGNHDPRFLWQITRIVRIVKPDVIHTFLTQMDILGGLVGLITRTPFIVAERTSELCYPDAWKIRMRSRIGIHANFVVANSAAGMKYWESRRHSEDIRVIPNIIPRDEILAMIGEPGTDFGIRSNREVILFAGRYSPEKNPLALLDAIPLVLRDRPDAVAIFFGEGPLRREMEQRVKAQGLAERIKILPYTEELWSWMKRANVFVSTSIGEGCPNAVCEAAIAGCPLVLSDIPEHRELLENGATFVSHLDPAAIARGILKVLRDEKEARRKANIAFGKLSRFSSDLVSAEYLSVYQEVLSRSNARRSEAKPSQERTAESKYLTQDR